MSTYKYIVFDEVDNGARKTSKWECRNLNSKDLLGVVKWHGSWRRYCFFTTSDITIFSAGCLEDIQDFITREMLKRKGVNLEKTT